MKIKPRIDRYWVTLVAPGEICGELRKQICDPRDVAELEQQLAAAREQRDQAHKFLAMAKECLADYGNVDYDMMTQCGNQGLRHVASALECLSDSEIPNDSETVRDIPVPDGEM